MKTSSSPTARVSFRSCQSERTIGGGSRIVRRLRTYQVGQAFELDSAFAVSPTKRRLVTVAVETDEALALVQIIPATGSPVAVLFLPRPVAGLLAARAGAEIEPADPAGARTVADPAASILAARPEATMQR